MSIVERDVGYYESVKKEMNEAYTKQVDASFSRTHGPGDEAALSKKSIEAPLGRAILKVETNLALRKVGLVWLVDSRMSDLGPRVMMGTVVHVHPEQIDLGGVTRPHGFRTGDVVLVDRKDAKRLIRGAKPGMLVSIWIELYDREVRLMPDARTVVMGLDLSSTNAAACVIPGTWKVGDFESLSTHCVGYQLKKGSQESARIDRMVVIARHMTEFGKANKVTDLWIEDYAYGAKYQSHQIGELGGIVKLQLRLAFGVTVIPVPVLRARKVLLGKFPKKKRGGQKKSVFDFLVGIGAKFKTDDEADAFVVANFGMAELGLAAVKNGVGGP